MNLSLDPRLAAKKISHSHLVRLLESQISEREDREKIIQGVEEFFVLTSEFVQLRSQNKFSDIYQTSNSNDHYIVKRSHGDFVFEIDSYVPNEKYFERVVIKIYPKDWTTGGSILTLFLVPEACEK